MSKNKQNSSDQSKLWSRFEREKTERFRHSYEIQSLEAIELQYNVELIQHKCSEWLSQIHSEHRQFKDLKKMVDACVRILAHSITKDSTLQRAAVEVSHFRSENNRLMSENARLKKENKTLKAMNEYEAKEKQ